MENINSIKSLEERLKNKNLGLTAIYNLFNLKLNTILNDDEKRLLLNELTSEEIKIAYYRNYIIGIFDLLPESFKDDEEIVLLAYLRGENVSNMSDRLKCNEEFNKVLSYYENKQNELNEKSR